jgi:dienelactone hydrolase
MTWKTRLTPWLIVLLGAPRAVLADPPSASEVFASPSPGPVVVMISGASGLAPYRGMAQALQQRGYHVALIDGRDVLTRDKDGMAVLKGHIAQARSAPLALQGKVAVVGFSQGGGGALLHASTLRDEVAAVVAFYPAISWSPNMPWLAQRMAVPVLILAGEQDRYNGCCLIEDMRTLDSAARRQGAPLSLVTYPEAEHGFNLPMGAYRRADADDAWSRMLQFLADALPPPRTP